MKLKYLLLIVFFSLTSRFAVNSRISAANYCSVDEDCVIFQSSFSCGEYVNKKELDAFARKKYFK